MITLPGEFKPRAQQMLDMLLLHSIHILKVPPQTFLTRNIYD